ncbi:MAG: hypothetical protein MUE65_04450 [Methanomassiliicoccales archaeon]|nr:hypothetical protein [Methanomassiliicoccales archaeon]
MASLRRYFRRNKKLLALVMIIAYLLIDATFVWYIGSNSTAEMPAAAMQFSSEVVTVDRSSKGFVYVLDEDKVTKLAYYGSYVYLTPHTPTSMEVGIESDAMALGLTDDSVELYWSEGEQAEWSRLMNGTPTVIAISEKGTQFGYNPDTVYVLTENQTAKALVGLNALRYGQEVMHWPYEGEVMDVARSDNMHYFALAFDSSSVTVFSKDHMSPLGNLTIPGQVLELEYSSSGTRLAVLYEESSEHKVAVYAMPGLARVALQTVGGAAATNLRLHGDRSLVYVQTGDRILSWNIEGGVGWQTFRDVEGLQDYVMPSVSDDLFTSASGKISNYVPGMGVAKWSSSVGGDAPTLITDAGGWEVLGYDSDRLLMVDNTRELSGSKTLWTAFGVLLIIQVLSLVVIFYWKRLAGFSSRSLVAMAAGAAAGMVVAAFLTDTELVDWFGDPMVYLMVSAAVAALASWIAWESQAGIGGIVLGTVLGIPLAIAVSWLAAFLLWVSGYEFPGTEEIFTTAALSLFTGLKMGLVGSVTGAVLSRYYKQKG